MFAMCDPLYERIHRIANWRVIVVLFLANLACIAGFNWRHKQLNNLDPPDALSFYTPDQLKVFFSGIGESGRQLYALTQITLDVAYPAVYGLLFATLLVLLFPWARARCIVWLPVITVVFDLLENFTTAYLAWTFNDQSMSVMAKAAPIFSTAKWWGVTLCLAAIGLGVVLKLFSLLRSKARP